MTITPLDIQNKEFERTFRGYEIEGVDEFLDRIAKDLEQLIRENNDYKEQIELLQEKNKTYHKMEETMHNAIVVAQETAEEVKQSAKREAELIKKDAEREAKQILEEARMRAGRVLGEHEELLKRARVFKMRFKAFLETQLTTLDSDEWMTEQLKGQGLGNTLKKQPTREPEPKVPVAEPATAAVEEEDKKEENPPTRPRLELAPNREPEPDQKD
jgi:cell division initiation protein